MLIWKYSYVLGGMKPITGDVFNDLYVLSLPGFVWFKANYTAAVGRGYQRCLATGNSQMIVLGGYVQPTPDVWSQGIGVYDLPSMSERSSYDPKAPSYDTPQAVKDWYKNVYVPEIH
jgi:hypothetical protein